MPPMKCHDELELEEEHVRKYPSLPKKRRGMRARNGNLELLLGKDISLEQVPDFLAHALVGCFCGKVIARASLQWWIQANWISILRYEPTFTLSLEAGF